MASPAPQPAEIRALRRPDHEVREKTPRDAHHHDHICRRHAAGTDRHVLVVCTGPECRNRGSAGLLEMLKQWTFGTRTEVRISTAKCLGHCAAAPAMVEDGSVLRWVSLRRLHSELLRLGIL
jgi:NADH:ubiquinone oxidoreductase subunit E